MKKTYLALATLVLPAVSLADVTLYGEMHGGYEYNKTYSSTLPLDADGKPVGGSGVNDWKSRIGFKGSEDLGNGLKAIWQVESSVFVDGSKNGSLGSRDTFVGLAGEGWGTLRLGRLSNYANDSMELIDPGFYSDQSVGGLAYLTRLDDRVNNAIRYDSPDWNGFRFAVLYGADERRTKRSGSTTNNQTWNVGLSYERDGFFGKYNYERWGDADKLAATKDWHRVEAGYQANDLYLVASYQQIQGYGFGSYYSGVAGTVVQVAALRDLVNNGDLTPAEAADVGKLKLKTHEVALTAGYRFGALTPYLSYAKGFDARLSGKNVNKSGYDQVVVALDYALSKRTELYSSYGRVKWKNSRLGSERSFGLGMVHRF
ncbi:porin [Paludibacterium paludis]|uniref:Major outer membrane protein P.IA n=1 Tax=Paludibacterium paludis TaxID=1225769 RepID=A0A918U7N3_9NEIS|nr:porin [Paludibacterium paludis]GGY05231.1 major outer membrane protein P.IA [Paludibacterium paludis]